MIDKKRVDFWSERYIIKYQGSSERLPFTKIDYVKYFKNKKVLEIGPGEGRQLLELEILSKEYHIADISQKVLDFHKSKIENRFLITGYDNDFKNQYDVIALFYVFHHVLKKEIDDFLRFLERHLKKDGHIVFNIPVRHGIKESDGTNTTEYDYEVFRKLLAKHNFQVVHADRFDKRTRGDNFLMVIKK